MIGREDRPRRNVGRLGGLLFGPATMALGVGVAAADAPADPSQRGWQASERGDVVLAQAAATQTYAIPAGPLAAALNRFAEESRLQLVYATEIAGDARTAGVRGNYTPEQALRVLLAGTGISHRFAAADVVTLDRASPDAEGGAMQLAPIAVEGEAATALDPGRGFVAERSATATKTDTPLIETPKSVSVITQDRLRTQDAGSLNEALRYTPGVMGEAFGNDSRVDFLQYRGFDEGGTGVFRDGLQLRSSGFAEFRPELYGAQRVDVLRGPSSVLYGQSPPGGLVNIISKRPTAEAFGEADFGVGTFDLFEGRFDVGGPIDSEEGLFFRLTGLARSSETQVDFVDDDRVFVAPALTWRPNADTSLTVLTSFQDDATGSTNQFLPAVGTVRNNPNGDIPSRRFAGEPDFDQFDRTAFALGYSFEHRASDVWSFRQNARYDSLDVDSESVFGGGLAADQRTLRRFAFTTDADAQVFTIDNQAQAEFTTSPAAHTVLVGLDYQRYDVEETQGFGSAPPIDIFDPDYGADIAEPPVSVDAEIVQNQLGLYVQEQAKLFDRVILTLGGRHDFVWSDRDNELLGVKTQQDESEFSWRAGIGYLFDIGLTPYFSYSQSFLPIVGVNAAGDAFEPERAEQYEFGLKYQPPGMESFASVAFFDLTRENVRTPDQNNPLNQVQTGEVRSRGVELEGVASFDFGLNLIAAYTYQDVEITESNAGDEGNRPTTVPEHLAAVWVDYAVPEGPLTGLRFGSGVRYKGSTYGNAQNTLRVDDNVLVDASVSYAWQGFTLGVVGKNLTDRQYVAACSSASACFYGTDRTVVGRIGYTW